MSSTFLQPWRGVSLAVYILVALAPAPCLGDDAAQDMDTNAYQLLQLLNQNEALSSEISRLRGQVEELVESAERAREITAMHDLVASATQAPVQPSAAETIYESALENYRAAEYEAAVLGFQAFLQLYGEDPLSTNARYWLAEALLRQGQYDSAISTGEMLLIERPDSQKAADTMFLIGKAYLELGDASGARGAWEDLVATYPYSDPASKAQALLDQLP